jgi:hypothetical protein
MDAAWLGALAGQAKVGRQNQEKRTGHGFRIDIRGKVARLDQGHRKVTHKSASAPLPVKGRIEHAAF